MAFVVVVLKKEILIVSIVIILTKNKIMITRIKFLLVIVSNALVMSYYKLNSQDYPENPNTYAKKL